jgi:hypothetical protein
MLSVSKVQELQLTTLGGNVTTLELHGNFDDCDDHDGLRSPMRATGSAGPCAAVNAAFKGEMVTLLASQ